MLNLCKQFQCHEISYKTQTWRRPEIGLEFSGVSSNVAHPKKAQKIEQKHLPSSLKLINSSEVRLLLTQVSTVLLEKLFHIFWQIFCANVSAQIRQPLTHYSDV
jgi:hypothetical protein